MPKPIVTAAAESDTELPLTQDPSIRLPTLDLPPDDGDASVSSSISPCATGRDITESHPRASGAGEQNSSTPSVLPALPVLPPIFPNTDDDSVVSAGGFSSFLNDTMSGATTHNLKDEDVAKTQYFAGRMKFKGEGIRANKDLFLMYPSSHEEISPSLLLNGTFSQFLGDHIMSMRLCATHQVFDWP
jgi:hypothetical protein